MNKHFLSLLDLEHGELEEMFLLTDALKHRHEFRPLAGKVVTLLFQKPSLRTRVSFEVGIHQLGGDAIFLSQEGVGLGTRESASDVAGVLSGYGDMIVARLFEHQTILDLATHATVPVINALTDLSHPCQVLGDLYTLHEMGKLTPGVKIAFVGDGNNVVHSWLEMATLYPMHFVLAAPDGYWPDVEILRHARESGVSTIEITDDPAKAAYGADAIYTDVWTSMGQEMEAEIRRKAFAPYQVNARLLALAGPDCAVMHCLPAHRGEEITDEVIDGSQSVVLAQARNRMHVQKAVMVKLMESCISVHPAPTRRRTSVLT